jgi:hypothetical protein
MFAIDDLRNISPSGAISRKQLFFALVNCYGNLGGQCELMFLLNVYVWSDGRCAGFPLPPSRLNPA